MLHQAHAFAPIGCPLVDATNLVLVALGKLAPHDLVASLALFLRVAGELGFHHIAVEHALLVEQVDTVERKPGAQWSPPGPSIVTHDPQRPVQCVVEDCHAIVIGPSSRSRISVARSALSASVSAKRNATESPPEVVQSNRAVSWRACPECQAILSRNAAATAGRIADATAPRFVCQTPGPSFMM